MQDGDHFFSHDDRFMSRLIGDIHDFINTATGITTIDNGKMSSKNESDNDNDDVDRINEPVKSSMN
jgi:hypothetical protein